MAMRARLSPAAVRDRMSSLLLELATVEDNLPRLIRAATTRLTEPAASPSRPDRTLPFAVLIGAAMIAGAILLS